MIEREDRDAYMPTKEEIRAACARIQATWSEYERYKRMVTPPSRWLLPVVKGQDLPPDIDS